MPKPVAHSKLRLVKPQASSLAQEQPHFALSKPGDTLEREADRAAEAVMTGRPVATHAGFSFGDVAVGQIQRQDAAGPTPPAQQTDEDKYKEAALKVGEAALKTEAGKKLLEKVENDKLVKEGKKFFDTTAGKIVVGTIAAGGAAGLVGGLAAAKKPLPFQLPEIPVSDTLKLGLTIEGPLNQPTSGMLTITFSESGSKSSKKKSGSELSRETAELRRSLEMFKPKPAEEKKKEEEEKPAVQRKESSADPLAAVSQSVVGETLDSPGRPLDPATRGFMESRFGHDFSQVRVHDDLRAAASAESVNALAYTVGPDLVFGAGRYAPHSSQGRELLAHELAHVVQNRGVRTDTPTIMRRSGWESFKIWIGAEEGEFADDELLAYLKGVTSRNKEEGNYDSDNKARAIVNRMKAGNKKFSPDAAQKILLIKEMQSGFTGDDDEQAILYLLQGTSNAELSTMLHSGLDLVDLDSDIHGEEEDRYRAFLDTRFEGGSKSVLAGKIKLKPWTETIGKLEAEVSDISDIEEVKRIRKDIQEKYGIELDSDVGIEGIKKRYTKVPKGAIDGLKKRPWHLDELHALERALVHYAPILGAARGKSTRAKAAQEVTTTSKVEQSIDVDKATGVLDTTTMGEYFGDVKNFSLFKAAEGKSGDFPGDVPKQLEGTITHELAHGLMKYELPRYVSRFKYWINENTADADKDTRVAKKNVEAPITFYGGTSAGEDISEATMFYFVEPETLKKGRGQPKGTPGNPAPERFEFLDDAVKKWTPKPKAEKPKGKKP
jgi:hypothetical protein